MAKFKCQNCGEIFFLHVGSRMGSQGPNPCPKCGSSWTDYVGPGLEPAEKPVTNEEERSG